MTDPRFYRRCGPFSLKQVAEAVGGVLDDPDSADFAVHDVAPLETAGLDEITVYSDVRYLSALRSTRAGAAVTSEALACQAPAGCRLILAPHPRLAYAQIGHLFYPAGAVEPFLSPEARIHPSARLGDGVRIEAGAAIDEGAEIGAGSHVEHNAVIGRGVVLGARCRVGPNSAISHALIGDDVRIGSCVSIGGPGFGFVPTPAGPLRMQQLGRVVIEDLVEIGANSAIDRGATGDTVVGRGTVIDNLVQIGHNVQLGRYCVLSGQAGIAGSTVLGDGVMVGGQSAISDHLTIGAGAQIAGKSGVMRDVEPGGVVGGYPAMPIRQWHRQTAALIRLVRRKAGATD